MPTTSSPTSHRRWDESEDEVEVEVEDENEIENEAEDDMVPPGNSKLKTVNSSGAAAKL
jgi:hypothetical protein